MRTITCFLILLAVPASASGYEKRLRVPADDTAEWATPERFGREERIAVRVFVNGREVEDTTYAEGPCPARYGWVGRSVLVDAMTVCRRAPIRFRVGNLRDRAVTVTVRYRRLGTDNLSGRR